MKMVQKIILAIVACVSFAHMPTHCLFRGDGSGALTGAAIGGLAGGRKGAGIGLGVGLATDMIGNASQSRRSDDEYYSRREDRKRKREMRDLEEENEALREELARNKRARQ